MAIRRSASREVDELIARLDSPNDIERDAAIARLRVIGARTLPHLIDLARAGSARSRVAALHVLEALPDRRSLALLTALLVHEDPQTAAAAAAALGPLLATPDEDRIIDALLEVLTDARRDSRVRRAALGALSALGPATLSALAEHLEQDAIKADLRRDIERCDISPEPVALADGATETRRRLARRGAALSIVDLCRLVSAIRDREAAEPDPVVQREWMTARAVAHQMLAARGTRVALYDLRETLETASGPLPVEFLAALERVGDAACAAAIVAAYANAPALDWWSQHLAATFRVIAKRERLTRRSPALQRAARRWPQIVDELFTRGGTNPRI